MQDLVALLKEDGFTVVETVEIQPLRFSAFPGASIIRADIRDEKRGIRPSFLS